VNEAFSLPNGQQESSMLPKLVEITSALFVLLASGPAGQLCMERVTLNELLAATGGRSTARDPQTVSFGRVAIDSRTVEQGDLFWALCGERHDGHNFVAEASRRGAVGCVVNSETSIPRGLPAALVADTSQGLKDLARWYRQRRDALVVGITGSVGKTTTREMIYSVLRTRYEGCRSRKNYNNHVGLPLSVLDMHDRDEFAVLEMGASHVGEIRELASIAAPEIGVVTGIGVSHLEGFGSVAQIAESKGELVEALPAGGFAVLNGDDSYTPGLAGRARCPVVTVGQKNHNTICASAVEVNGPELRFTVDGSVFTVQAAGRHHLTGALASLAIARELGLSTRQIAEGFAQFSPVEGRCQVHHLGAGTLIDDTYNANPTSVEAACRLLGEWQSTGQRILVLGDMAELGDQSAAWHRTAGRTAATVRIDRLAVLGRHAADVVGGALEQGMTSHQLAACDTLDVLLTVLDCWSESGDVVLVKGSRMMQMERVSQWFVNHSEFNKEITGPGERTRACA
jgi:UDP-N-acetylmuramoyl-tripeptide--D-alanyl-D-alanine ligase